MHNVHRLCVNGDNAAIIAAALRASLGTHESDPKRTDIYF